VRLQLAARPAEGHSIRSTLLAAAKKFSTAGAADEEDVGVVSGDARYDLRLGSRPVLLGARVSYYDAFERDTIVTTEVQPGMFVEENVDGDFRTGDAAVLVTLLGENEQRILASAGGRFFHYKPDRRFDSYGELAALAYTRTLHVAEPDAEEPRTLDLVLQYAAQRRRFDQASYANVCPDYRGADDPELCILPTPFARIDLFHSAAAEVLYSGSRLWGARYELHVNDSTSFGESLVRHRLELSGTGELFGDLFLTARVVLQLNQFLDPALREGDTGTFITIEDESKNAFFLHVTRDLSEAWTLEARYALYANAFSESDIDYRRHTVYAGVIYGFQTAP
jgi:hypothetical protein